MGWQRPLDSGNALYGKQNMASCSPVSDGTLLWAMTGTGVLTCFTMDGEQRWQRRLQDDFGEFSLNWGYASSPTLIDRKVVVQVLHGSTAPAASYVVAFDGGSGETAWKVERKTGATRECPDAYTTPVLLRQPGGAQIIVSGANFVTSHNAADGAEVWRCGGLNPSDSGNYRICASPLVVGERVIVPSRVRPMIAVRAGGAGDVTDTHRAWTFDEPRGTDVPTPVSDGERVFLVNDRGIVTCLDATSGEVVWGPQRTASGTVSASPLLADGRVYITNEQAVTTVLEAGPAFKTLATNDLDDSYTLASIAVSSGQLFIRTSDTLYCIGKALDAGRVESERGAGEK